MPKTREMYWLMIRKRAWDLGYSRARSKITLISIGLTALGTWRLAFANKTLAWMLPVVVIIGYVGYQVVQVLYESYADIETENEDLSFRQANLTNHQSLADVLTKHHARGKDLLRPVSGKKLREPELQTATDAWVSEIVEDMRRHNCPASEVYGIESVVNADARAASVVRFVGKERFIAIRNERLERLIEKHANIAERIRLGELKEA